MNRFARRLAVLACGLSIVAVAMPACAVSEIEGVTEIVAAPLSGGLNLRIDDADNVKVFMREVNAERRKLWKPFRGKASACAVRFSFYAQERRMARLVLDGNQLIEFMPASDTTGWGREVARLDLAGVRRLAAKVKSPGACTR
jgi:hypothetical protein